MAYRSDAVHACQALGYLSEAYAAQYLPLPADMVD
jgi:hypothetical protein